MIVDNHPATGVGLAAIVTTNPMLHVVAAPATVDAALSLDLPRVDVCILGLSAPILPIGTGAPDPIARVHSRWPTAQVLIIAEYDDDEHLSTYLQRGAAGFVSKRAAPDDILSAVLTVARGERCFIIQPEQFPGAGVVSPAPDLSSREQQVLRLLASGMSVSDIAADWGLSVKTASSHKMSLQRKLGVRNTAQIVPRARELGLL